MHTVAAIQMISTPSITENLATARRLVAQAASEGAMLVVLPEYWAIMGQHETDKLGHAEQPGSGPIQDGMAQMAREHGSSRCSCTNQMLPDIRVRRSWAPKTPVRHRPASACFR